MDAVNYHTSPANVGQNMNIDTWVDGAPRCVRCCNPIYDPTVVTSDNKFWHKSCFRCSYCNCELDEACITNGREMYCKNDFDRLFKSPCAGCSVLMEPSEFVRRIYGNLYHEGCFKCVMCSQPLRTGDRVYLRDDSKLVCHTDYNKLHIGEASSDEEDCNGSDLRMGINISQTQTDILTAAYTTCAHPSRHIRQRLSHQTGLGVSVIRNWFRNKRLYDRKHCHQHQGGEKPFNHNDLLLKIGSKTDKIPSLRTEWLTSAFSFDSVPPNIDLSPQDIQNGEVCKPMSFVRENNNSFSDFHDNIRWNPCL